MNKRVIKYIQDNRLMLLIGITIAIGFCTIMLVNSYVFSNKITENNNIKKLNTNENRIIEEASNNIYIDENDNIENSANNVTGDDTDSSWEDDIIIEDQSFADETIDFNIMSIVDYPLYVLTH